MKTSPARKAAFDILLRVETTDAYTSELLHSSRVAALSPADHGLATEIVMGVLRWRSVLDEQIAQYLSRAKLDAEVSTALRIGAYQLVFLDRIPAHAAINESVELVKQARKRSAAGMANAILRKIKPGGKASSPAAAHPAWLVQRWEDSYGTEVAQKICTYDQQAPSTTIRADGALVEELQHEGITLEPNQFLSNCCAVTRGDVTRTRAFRERRLVIQDEGSQLIALLVGRGERILDCCAAPGGKARILAEQNPQANVVAVELHPHRAALLKRLVPLPNVRVAAADARALPFAVEFDRILVDAPCTGTGTLARNPEIKWRLTPEHIGRLQHYQIAILSAAMKHVAPGGRILYSTCSLEPEENEAVVEKVFATEGAFRVLDVREHLEALRREGVLVWQNLGALLNGPYLRTIPGVYSCDGFFGALLEREL